MTKWGHGKYGTSGGRAVAARLDALAGDGGLYFRSSPDSERGFQARLRYVLEHRGGGEALNRAGLKPDVDRVVGWLLADTKPTRRSREGVDAAYRELRRQNVARSLRGRLTRPIRVTVEPLPASALPTDRQTRQQQFVDEGDREVTIRPSTWHQFIDAWEDEDYDTMDDVWMDDVAGDMDSPPEGWFEVQHVGFSA